MIVAAAVIQDENGRYLICQKGPESGSPFLWEFPGGKVETPETPEECLKRELMEELGVEVEPGGFLSGESFGRPGREARVLFYRCRITGGVPKALEHLQILFVTALELQNYEFTPPDRALADMLLKTEGSPPGGR